MKITNKMKSRDAKGNPAAAVGAAVLVMLLISILLLLLLALLLYKMSLNESVVRIGIVVIYVIAGVAGGLVAGKTMKEKKYLWGLLAGAIYFVVLFAAGFALHGGLTAEPAGIFASLALCLASGMAGGMVS
jgi:putative membrane protein (TIGR04086 family)